jgi:hypothetical protein
MRCVFFSVSHLGCRLAGIGYHVVHLRSSWASSDSTTVLTSSSCWLTAFCVSHQGRRPACIRYQVVHLRSSWASLDSTTMFSSAHRVLRLQTVQFHNGPSSLAAVRYRRRVSGVPIQHGQVLLRQLPRYRQHWWTAWPIPAARPARAREADTNPHGHVTETHKTWHLHPSSDRGSRTFITSW